jgi:hypothetical protein
MKDFFKLTKVYFNIQYFEEEDVSKFSSLLLGYKIEVCSLKFPISACVDTNSAFILFY